MSSTFTGSAEHSVIPKPVRQLAARTFVAIVALVLAWQGVSQAEQSFDALKSDYEAAGPPYLPSSDFPMFYAGAERARHLERDLYDEQTMVRAILLTVGYDPATIGDDVAVSGSGNEWFRYYNPPIYLFLLSPLTLLDLHDAFLVSIGLNLALGGLLLVLIGVVLRWRRPHTWLLALGLFGCLPFYYSLHHFQPTILIACLLTGGFIALRAGRSVLAAALLVLVGVKPHWLVPIGALLHEERRLIRPFLAAGVVFFILPFLLLGPLSLIDYVRLILSRGQGDLADSTYPRVLWGWNGFLRALTGDAQPELWLVASAATLAVFLLLWKHGPTSTRLAGAVLTALLTLPHVNPQDWLLVVPALAILLTQPWGRVALPGIALLALSVFIGANDWPRVVREMGQDGRGVYWVTVATFGLLLWITAATVVTRERRAPPALHPGEQPGPRPALLLTR